MTRLQTVIDRAQRHAERMPSAHVRWARYYRLRALRHAQEEDLDLANYLETLIQQETQE